MKKLISAFMISSMLVVLPACFGGDSSKPQECCPCDMHHAGHEHIKEVVPGVVLVNVLDKEHFENCRIQGSINVPFEEVDKFVDQLTKEYQDKTAIEVIVYCSNYMCSASGEAAKMLAKRGFTNVKAYEAGMAEWYQQGLPTEGPCKLEGFAYLKKKMTAPAQQEHEFAVITTQELAEKLGVAADAKSTEIVPAPQAADAVK